MRHSNSQGRGLVRRKKTSSSLTCVQDQGWVGIILRFLPGQVFHFEHEAGHQAKFTYPTGSVAPAEVKLVGSLDARVSGLLERHAQLEGLARRSVARCRVYKTLFDSIQSV